MCLASLLSRKNQIRFLVSNKQLITHSKRIIPVAQTWVFSGVPQIKRTNSQNFLLFVHSGGKETPQSGHC